MLFSDLDQIAEHLLRILRIILLVPFLLVIFIGGALALWHHNFNPLLWSLLIATVIEILFWLSLSIYFRY